MAYEINWYFSKENKKDLIKIIKILGSKSLDGVKFLDKKGKTIESYANQHIYPSGYADCITIKNINQILRKNKEITEIQIIKK